jgi:hypothetical protein
VGQVEHELPMFSTHRVAIAAGPATHHKHSQLSHICEMMALKPMMHNQPRSCATGRPGSMEHPCRAQSFHCFHHVCLSACLPAREDALMAASPAWRCNTPLYAVGCTGLIQVTCTALIQMTCTALIQVTCLGWWQQTGSQVAPSGRQMHTRACCS